MTTKIIALVDGSTYSRSVCDHAAWIAGRATWEVELMHVLGRREGGGTADLSGAISLGARSALLQELSSLDEKRSKLAVQRGRAILEDAKAIFEDAGVHATEHLRHGDLVEAISDTSGNAEMILIGKRGEAVDFAKGHLGSNLERVMRSVEKPLFVASRAFRPIERVLIAYDGSASARRAVDYVAQSPIYAGLAVSVVTVGSATDTARKGLEEAEAMLDAAGFDARIETREGQPEDTLSRMIDEVGFDHLVMGASGHSRLRALFVGSTSLEMIRTCKVPVLLVR
ncbi:Nucleotide-binding universal stress protein, UspA family [Palleronia marisminoris]|uniref:Universal stress protein family protein n=1 Tax=Palleronia marisminoris TaxID=315423 RepID=A0A1Y5S671_9RHOB|nr:universal stress protein [Palleronia marisminoris]SFG64443.1 Nucleotide-binding universal stress protein, UspA family [Palleronia marisminoris]SLN33382.1 Universal stress protein family protein [Palleronia marisminoris]